MEISEEDGQKLTELENRAADKSLSAGQRQEARDNFERFYQSIHSMDNETKKELARLAASAYGSNGWNSLAHKKNLYNSIKSLYDTRVDLLKGPEDHTLWLQELLFRQGASGWQDSASQLMA